MTATASWRQAVNMQTAGSARSPASPTVTPLSITGISAAGVNIHWKESPLRALTNEMLSTSIFAGAVAEYSLKLLFSLAGDQAPRVDERFRRAEEPGIIDPIKLLAHLHCVVSEYLQHYHAATVGNEAQQYYRYMRRLGLVLGRDPLDRKSAI